MDSRHDSFYDSEDKRSSFGVRDIPSSPLSSVPGDFEFQEIPQDLQDIAMPDSSVVQDNPRLSPASSSAMMDTIRVASPDRMLHDSPTFVRRSERKRKAPARYLESAEADDIPHPVRPDTPERPIKQRKISKPKNTRKVRGKKEILANELPLFDEEIDEPASTIEQINTSRVVKIKVNPERLGQILDPAPLSPSAAVPSPELVPLTRTESETAAPSSGSMPPISTESELAGLELEALLPADQPTFDAAGYDLVALSLAITKKVPIEQKPHPRGHPEIWAESRHHLCESLSGLYASWQGSYYGKNGVA
jgi:hypothetical protein